MADVIIRVARARRGKAQVLVHVQVFWWARASLSRCLVSLQRSIKAHAPRLSNDRHLASIIGILPSPSFLCISFMHADHKVRHWVPRRAKTRHPLLSALQQYYLLLHLTPSPRPSRHHVHFATTRHSAACISSAASRFAHNDTDGAPSSARLLDGQ